MPSIAAAMVLVACHSWRPAFAQFAAAGPPRLLYCNGCSGSTFATKQANTFLRQLGVRTYKISPEAGRLSLNGTSKCSVGINGIGESFKREKNCFALNAQAHDEDPDGADLLMVQRTCDAVTRAGGTWLANPSDGMTHSMAAEAVRVNARAVSMTRGNALDRLVCQVRDCFLKASNGTFGHVVDAAGNASRACFQERRKDHVVSLAFLETKAVVKFLRRQLKMDAEQLAKLTSVCFRRVEAVEYERLAAFEMGDLNPSVTEWHAVFKSWNYDVPLSKTAALLAASPAFNSRPPPGSQRNSIYNFDDVRRVILATRDRALIELIRA
jgi:hypothetical protein